MKSFYVFKTGYTLENLHGTQTWRFGSDDSSFSIGRCLGSMLIFRGVIAQGPISYCVPSTFCQTIIVASSMHQHTELLLS